MQMITIGQPAVLAGHLRNHNDYVGECDKPEPGGQTGVGVWQSYRVMSLGKDGKADAESPTGVWVDFNSDLVNEGGNFVQTKY